MAHNLKTLFSQNVIAIKDLERMIEEIEIDIEYMKDEADDNGESFWIDPDYLTWLDVAKDFYSKVSCYHGDRIVSDCYLTEYFYDTVYELLKDCDPLISPFVDRGALTERLAEDLTTFIITYPDTDINERWYIV